MIDPATSFANALNQGLGIMRSYRDEAKADEDRAFNKRIRLAAETRLDKALQLQVGADRRQAEVHNFEYGIDPETGKSRKGQTYDLGINLTEQQIRGAKANADVAEFNADPEWLKQQRDLSVREAEAGILQRRAAAGSSNASADYYRERTAGAREERFAAAQQKAFFNWMTAAQQNDQESLRNNPAGLSVVGRMAANVLNVPSLMEAIQNPTGNWVNDPKKVSQVFSFSNYSIGQTGRQAGMRSGGRGSSGPRLQNPRAGSRNIEGRNVPTIEFQITGIDARTGKPKTIDSYAIADKVFDAGVLSVKVHRQMAASPSAQAQLIAQLGQDPESRQVLNDILEDRIKQLESYIKGKDDLDESTNAARAELAQLTGTNLGAFPEGGTAHTRMKQENSRVVAQTIFRGLGRAFQD